jgi:hypothetical protein
LRKLTNNERRLLWFLGGAIFVIANFYGVSYLLDREADLSSKLSELESTIKSHHVWLQEKDFWLARKRWLDAKQPEVGKNEVPQSELLEALTKSAAANQLQIQEQSFGESRTTAHYRSVAVRLKLTGSLQNVIKWLVEMQQPERFQAVTSFSLKNAEAPPTVSLELEVARWYAPQA